MSTSQAAGLVAILRGITPVEAPAIGEALYDAGFRRIEVPLNSPNPLESIRLLAELLPCHTLIGAGTVVDPADVDRVHQAGGKLVIAPNTDPEVIARTLALGMEPYPGAATATEVFSALSSGARTVKVFPAPSVGIAGMKAWAATVPEGTQFLPVGGIDAETLPAWLAAGATGAGIGTNLYTPGRSADEVRLEAGSLQRIWASQYVGEVAP
ncbi:2-dehydro-3-deoxy-6-phosphogalactonate aldolase [Brachybacterium massiliense]|uniref:2-dehydro-3-deoxy-6-phosphogalactonate aldolase n=1 Tax=Brachybacterium massiliense TaxID=1755098 RepID=UPI000B3BAC8B|nr:2-dehydro-3-deoxy-6-phosphogalactonate aldolase [Brachybacterium massiliense]